MSVNLTSSVLTHTHTHTHTHRRVQGDFAGAEYFSYFDCSDRVSRVCAYVQTHQITHIRCVQVFVYQLRLNRVFPGDSVVKNPPAMQKLQEALVQSQCQENPLEEGIATHSRILAWRIPWTKESGGSMGLQRVGHD